MQHNIAIIVITYNRPESLSRLLLSLARADYSGFSNLPLIISVDKNEDLTCYNIANEFYWEYGTKTLIAHESPLGLKDHVILCGDMVNNYDGVIILEDDLMVAKGFYDYAQQSFDFYCNESKLAGIGLYSNCYNEVAYCSFAPVEDGFDNYFMQVPCSWGQLWTRQQWIGFKRYFENSKNEINNVKLPLTVSHWPDQSSWKKIFYRYMIANDLYFVYPRFGLSTNFAEPGKHVLNPLTVFQTSLLLTKKNMNFSKFDNSFSIYDAYFELTTTAFRRFTGSDIDLSFDLNGTKQLSEITSFYLISSKKSVKPIHNYDVRLYPYENNVLLNLTISEMPETFILAETKSFSPDLRFQRSDADIRKYFISREILIQKLVKKQLGFLELLIVSFKKIFRKKGKNDSYKQRKESVCHAG